MTRPRKCRYIENPAESRCFKPSNCGKHPAGAMVLYADEVEALRLADVLGLSQEEAAARMQVSRPTFARLIEEAHKKVAEAIVSGKPIATEGVEIKMDKRQFKCGSCGHTWELEFGSGCPGGCPECGSKDFHRVGCATHYQRGGQCGNKGEHAHAHSHGQGQGHGHGGGCCGDKKE